MRFALLASLLLFPSVGLAADLTPKSLVGTWSFTEEIETSQCPGTKRQDVVAYQWVISVTDGRVTATPVGREGAIAHTGKFSDAGPLYLSGGDNANNSSVWLTWRGTTMSGSRLYSRATANQSSVTMVCAVASKLELKKL